MSVNLAYCYNSGTVGGDIIITLSIKPKKNTSVLMHLKRTWSSREEEGGGANESRSGLNSSDLPFYINLSLY